jgi:hypothetical protein
MSIEADTCRMHVLPKLQATGWADDQIREQLIFTIGRHPSTADGPAALHPTPMP